ncbi:MAG: PIN domain nuclease [Sandaracinaceae bacterium]|nr:hypothetical protein [Myxococcales bacterium]MCB9656550.1 PIN domain nuclease [Sandaracinaceae bacterium]
MSGGLTMDTGALVALERGNRRMAAVWRAALARNVPITVPAVVVAEWWRGQRGPAARLLDVVHVEALTDASARRVGQALALLTHKRPSIVDAAVVVSAATRGDVVYTADLDDIWSVRDAVAPSVVVSGVGA